jgi:hypothetical protein
MSFCIFGIGSCGSKVKQDAITKKQFEKTKEIISENIHEMFLESPSTIENFQSIMAKAKGDVIITDIEMVQYAELTSKTEFNIKESLKSDELIKEIFDEASKIALESSGKGGILGTGSKVTTSTENDMLTIIKEKFKSIVRTKDVFKCVSTVLNTSKISGVSEDGKTVISGIHMRQTAKLVSDCTIDVIKKIFKSITIDEKIISKLETESKAIAETGFTNTTFYLLLGAILLVIILLYFLR